MEQSLNPGDRRSSSRRNTGRRGVGGGSRRTSREIHSNGLLPGAATVNVNYAKEVEAIRRHSADITDFTDLSLPPRRNTLQRLGQRMASFAVSMLRGVLPLWSSTESGDTPMNKAHQRRIRFNRKWRDVVIVSLILLLESLPFILGSYDALRACSGQCSTLPLVASAFLGTGASLSAFKCASESAMVSLFNVVWGTGSLFCCFYSGVCLLTSSECSSSEESIAAFTPMFPALGTLYSAAPEVREAISESIKDYVKEEKAWQNQRKAYNKPDSRSRLQRLFFALLVRTRSGVEGVKLYREDMASKSQFRAMRTNTSLGGSAQLSENIIPDGNGERRTVALSGGPRSTSGGGGMGQALKERLNNDLLTTKSDD